MATRTTDFMTGTMDYTHDVQPLLNPDGQSKKPAF